MAQSVMMIYESLDAIKGSKGYWKDYIDHYEKFWDGPPTPQSSWWGLEYEEFRNSLAERLGISKEHIKNAFFMKDEEKNYYVCPVGDSINMNIMASEDIIPYEWFLLFDSEDKNYFYTHTGFGAIHKDAIYYKTYITSALKRLEEATKILVISLEDNTRIRDFPELAALKDLKYGIENVRQWLGGFSENGMIVLNYGEICGLIDQNSYKYEDSVGEIHSIMTTLASGDLGKAESDLKLLNLKWAEIYGKSNNSSLNRSTLQ